MVPADWLTGSWPANAWLGVTAEGQAEAGERLPLLVELPAPVRFVSAEPLLEALDLTPWLPAVHWVISGGESGHGARECVVGWLRDLLKKESSL